MKIGHAAGRNRAHSHSRWLRTGPAAGVPGSLACGDGHAELWDLAWTGQQPVAIWSPSVGPQRSHGLYLGRLDATGKPLDGCGVQIVAGPNDNNLPQYPHVAWNGQHLAIVWHAAPLGAPPLPESTEIYFQRFDQLLIPIDPVPLRLTVDSTYSENARVVWADGEWGLTWEQDFISGYTEIAFARLHEDGTIKACP